MERQIRYRKTVDYFIDLVGLSTTGLFNVKIDSKYALIQIHPTYCLAIVPPYNEEHPTFEKMVFYTNCLTYDHEIPALLTPRIRKALVQPIERGRSKYINDSYFTSLALAYESINSIRLGPLAYINFRWQDYDNEIDIQYSKKYLTASKELSLFSSAIRQLDPLSEFLHYYRIIESISGSNGKNWISDNLDRLEKYDFGFLDFRYDLWSSRKRRINLFNIYRKRVLIQLSHLTNRIGRNEIPEYFYNTIRCGIAHGKSDIVEHDFDYNIREIAKDCYVLKLLARIAIEDLISINGQNLVKREN